MKARALSSEFKLIAACCRWPSSLDKHEEVFRLASGSIDWGSFVRQVRRQRVEGLVNQALLAAKAHLPEGVKAELSAQASGIGAQNLRFAAESARLQNLLQEEDIPFLFVKGLPLAILAYGGLGMKKAWDIDLLVEPRHVLEASLLLQNAGYSRSYPADISDDQFKTWVTVCKESVWLHQANGTVVELHSALVDNPELLPGVSATTAPSLVSLGAGITLPTLPKDELFTYICIHGAWHAWSRLKWLADVAALLSQESETELDRLYRRSLEMGAGRSAAQALLLCSDLLALQLPADLEAELRADRATVWLVSVAIEAMAGRGETELDETKFGTVPMNVSHFLLGRGWKYKFSELGRKFRTPEDQMEMPLPPRLHFLYPILALPRWILRRGRIARP